MRTGVKRKAEQFLDKAQRAIQAAGSLLQGEQVDFAAGRAYYAMFYVAEALLVEKGFEFRKHGGVHAAFGVHFTKTGELDSKFHRYLLEAFEARLEADYGVEIKLSVDAVKEMISWAEEFLLAAKRYLGEA